MSTTTPAPTPAGGSAGTTGGEKTPRYRNTPPGNLVSHNNTNTLVVAVEDRVKHALYGKVIRRTTKVKAHDEAETAGVGDLVSIIETRPLSATKRWRVVEVLERAK